VIADDLNEGSNDDNESLEGYDINFYFWSKWIIHNC
jgi:hypothetical protein